jgi:hypothetical protein
MPAKKKRAAGASWLRRYGRSRGPAKSSMKYSPGKVFVAMSFAKSPEKSEVYRAIVRACKHFNLSPSRVDENVGSGHILLEIVEAIEDGEFLIFDLTDGRPNVYYELGYAHGVGNRPEDIILIAKKDTKIHFDIMPLRILLYTSAKQLERSLKSQLQRLVPFSRGNTIPKMLVHRRTQIATRI